jgi:lysophospholipase L1-like esterase
MALLLFGYSPAEAIGAGVQLIVRDKDMITTAHIAEAVKYFASIKDNADMYVQNAAKNVEDVVSAVEDVNSDADIALIGMYNPYGNSLEYQGQVRDVCNVCQNIFVKAIDEAVDINVEVGDVQFVPASDAEQKSEDLKDISVEIKKIAVDRSYFTELKKQRLKALLTIAANELAYPIQYLTAGKTSDPQMRFLNDLLIDVADRHNATYVNVYDISNECNTDPHPTAEGHKEIADRLEAAVKDLVLAKMTSDPEEVLILGDVDSDGEVTVMDALAMQKYVADKPVSNFNEAVADINNDGEINITDTILIQKYTAGRPVDYPIGEPING